MRTLKFIIDGQIIKQDPNCDFSGLVPGTDGYLKAEFSFSPEWDGCAKVAGFFSASGFEYDPKVLMDGRSCMIPAEALEKRVFKIQVLGRNDGRKESEYRRLITNKVEVDQNGGKS